MSAAAAVTASSSITKHQRKCVRHASLLYSLLWNFEYDHESMYRYVVNGWDGYATYHRKKSYVDGFKAIKKLSRKLFNIRRSIFSHEHRTIMKRELRLINKMLKAISTCKSLYRNLDDDAKSGINNPSEESLMDYNFLEPFDSSL